MCRRESLIRRLGVVHHTWSPSGVLGRLFIFSLYFFLSLCSIHFLHCRKIKNRMLQVRLGGLGRGTSIEFDEDLLVYSSYKTDAHIQISNTTRNACGEELSPSEA
jgi:hypothetical protein